VVAYYEVLTQIMVMYECILEYERTKKEKKNNSVNKKNDMLQKRNKEE
jgi:hypothetical protein